MQAIKNINYLGTWSLLLKEVRRYMKVYNQTVVIPVVNALLFLAVFNLALGDRVKTIGNLSFGEFMAAGLVMMSLIQNAFSNTSSSLIMGKMMGTIIDYLMPPLSAFEITLAVSIAGATRGILVGILVAISISFFVDISIHNIWYMIFFGVSSAILLALLGIFSGVISETFDQMAAVNSYVIVPMSFLSGTFYSVNSLPGFWYTISQFNPFFYIIDGFRYGMTGHHDSNITTGMIVVTAFIIFMWATVQIMISKGYRIKN